MAMEMNREGRIFFDDQISEQIDLLLNIRGAAMLWRMEKKVSWITVIGDDGLRRGLKGLRENERSIIEELVFEKCSPYEVMTLCGMTDEEFADALEELQEFLSEEM